MRERITFRGHCLLLMAEAMRGNFVCKSCGVSITQSLNILSLKDPSVREPDFVDQQPLSSPGNAYKSYEPIERSCDSDKPAALEFSPQFWLNVEDIEATTKLSGKAKRLNGCCGLAGCDGPNILCRECDSEVGTMRSDCWTPLVFIADKTNLKFIREKQ